MLRIVKDKAKSLRSPSKEVALPLSERERALLAEMLQYLKDSQDPAFREKHPKVREGIGLAAPQVGVNKRLIAIHYQKDEEGKEFASYELANPRIVAYSVRQCYLDAGEGCLSVDDPHPGRVFRPYRIEVEAYDAKAVAAITIKAEGFDAIVLQHEIDHLDGILFYDRIDPKDPFKTIEGAIPI